jgi:hypothetical protein
MVTVNDVPTWPLYSLEKPSNTVFNATDSGLNMHIEPDTWREEGMALFAKYPTEFDLAGTSKPGAA